MGTDATVVFVPSPGKVLPKGKDWDLFMEEQQRLLDEHTQEGWRLVAAAPVLTGLGGVFGGILLYFELPD